MSATGHQMRRRLAAKANGEPEPTTPPPEKKETVKAEKAKQEPKPTK